MNRFVPITQAGLLKFKKEKEELLEKRKPAVENLRIAREMGDLSENAAYKVARGELSAIDARLRKLEYIIRFSKIIENENKDQVGFETKVKLEPFGSVQGKGVVEYTIVGGYESDPAKGKISHLSPIGRALFGKRKGEEVRVNTPGGVVVYKVIDVS